MAALSLAAGSLTTVTSANREDMYTCWTLMKETTAGAVACCQPDTARGSGTMHNPARQALHFRHVGQDALAVTKLAHI
jgi:hypothetical protein